MPEVIYRGKSEPQRVRAELGNKHGSLRPDSVTVQEHRTVVSIYHAAGVVPNRPGVDEVAKAQAMTGHIKPRM